MKTIRIFILLLIVGNGYAQNLNWANVKDTDKHFANASVGLDYGMVFSAGYGYKIDQGVILNLEYSQPAGSKAFDDLKTKIGGQVSLLNYNNFRLTARVHGVFRTNSNSLVRIVDFGSDLSGVLGYYKPRWFVAGEAGFDKAIVTHFKHTDVYREIYPKVTDGWYQPSTGGNFYYGLLVGMSFGRADVYLNAGKILTEDFKGTPFMPFYGRAGITYKFGK